MTPDFGWHTSEHEGVKLSCKYIAPGLTVRDLVMLFELASKDNPNDFSGNPAEWGVTKGVVAVTEAILKAVYDKPAE